MIVEVINTGTELLLGEILNTNFQYLSQELNRRGYDVLFQTTVGDNEKRLQDVLQIAWQRADIVITTGGLGPTRGDITKEVVASCLGLPLEMDDESLQRIQGFFANRGAVMPKNNLKQALKPLGAVILKNDTGTAPGLAVEHGKNLTVLLPGPPNEMKHVFKNAVLPFLEHKFLQQGIIQSRVLKLRGIGESTVAEKLDDIILAQSNPTIAIYARSGEIVIRITAKGSNESEAEVLINGMAERVERRLEGKIYGSDGESLPQKLGNELLKRKCSIAFAESCTGGLASSMLTDIPGSSEYLLGSVVSYSNMAKEKVLNVSSASLHKYGAVSEQVAIEMAEGVRLLLGTSLGVSITGIAGPGGGTSDKPVGLVYIAVSSPYGTVWKKLNFSGTRTDNKLRSALNAFSLALDKLTEEF
ncbi:MAG TPA: competence/damage-inducible protein A [Candidatus Avacidaminococcus intestinavium]|uniref:Putative competence-damage inducible protein n=1 Tax=Candidatus Avacidaminococcus intestinavium TaxID=2840684 RepID=A0A9D1MQ92_9FIRM|nr:competence/damage-inducible protein A [Candidatus Avacidaminococcus intestinavium]